MKIKPVILNKIETVHTNFIVELILDNNITFISGDSGVGKSAVYSFIEEMSVEDKRIRCFNYLDANKSYKKSIKNSKGKLFVIDNADILLNDDFRRYIATDEKNQYIIIGRNPTGLLLTLDDIYDLSHEKKGEITRFFLKRILSENG